MAKNKKLVAQKTPKPKPKKLTPVEPRHCDEYIDDETQPKCLRVFLHWNRWPATYKVRARQLGYEEPILYATWRDKRVRVTMASRFGDVGINSDVRRDWGYTARVYIKELSQFSNQA
jgi:hypothetical protein